MQYSGISQINTNQIVAQAEEYNKIVRKSETIISNSSVLDKLKSMVCDVLEVMPIVSALRAPFLDSH